MHLIWQTGMSRFGPTDMDPGEETHQDKIITRAAIRLKEMDTYLREQQVRHMVFLLPTRAQVVDDAPVDNRVRQGLAAHQIEAIYLLPALRALEPEAKKRRQWFHDAVHLEPAGHGAYGSVIGKKLAEHLAPH